MSMVEPMPSHYEESPEAELVRQIETLIRKMAADEATPNDVQQLQELQKLRIEMLRPRKFAMA